MPFSEDEKCEKYANYFFIYRKIAVNMNVCYFDISLWARSLQLKFTFKVVEKKLVRINWNIVCYDLHFNFQNLAVTKMVAFSLDDLVLWIFIIFQYWFNFLYINLCFASLQSVKKNPASKSEGFSLLIIMWHIIKWHLYKNFWLVSKHGHYFSLKTRAFVFTNLVNCHTN